MTPGSVAEGGGERRGRAGRDGRGEGGLEVDLAFLLLVDTVSTVAAPPADPDFSSSNSTSPSWPSSERSNELDPTRTVMRVLKLILRFRNRVDDFAMACCGRRVVRRSSEST